MICCTNLYEAIIFSLMIGIHISDRSVKWWVYDVYCRGEAPGNGFRWTHQPQVLDTWIPHWTLHLIHCHIWASQVWHWMYTCLVHFIYFYFLCYFLCLRFGRRPHKAHYLASISCGHGKGKGLSEIGLTGLWIRGYNADNDLRTLALHPNRFSNRPQVYYYCKG